MMKGEEKKKPKLPENTVTPAIQVNTEPKIEGVSFIEYPTNIPQVMLSLAGKIKRGK